MEKINLTPYVVIGTDWSVIQGIPKDIFDKIKVGDELTISHYSVEKTTDTSGQAHQYTNYYGIEPLNEFYDAILYIYSPPTMLEWLGVDGIYPQKKGKIIVVNDSDPDNLKIEHNILYPAFGNSDDDNYYIIKQYEGGPGPESGVFESQPNSYAQPSTLPFVVELETAASPPLTYSRLGKLSDAKLELKSSTHNSLTVNIYSCSRTSSAISYMLFYREEADPFVSANTEALTFSYTQSGQNTFPSTLIKELTITSLNPNTKYNVVLYVKDYDTTSLAAGAEDGSVFPPGADTSAFSDDSILMNTPMSLVALTKPDVGPVTGNTVNVSVFTSDKAKYSSNINMYLNIPILVLNAKGLKRSSAGEWISLSKRLIQYKFKGVQSEDKSKYVFDFKFKKDRFDNLSSKIIDTGLNYVMEAAESFLGTDTYLYETYSAFKLIETDKDPAYKIIHDGIYIQSDGSKNPYFSITLDQSYSGHLESDEFNDNV